MKIAVNRCFGNYEYVTKSHLEKVVDKRLANSISSLRNRISSILPKKFVTENATLSTRNLNIGIIMYMLDKWSNKSIIKSTSSDIIILLGVGNYMTSNISYQGDWTKERVIILSNRLNEIYKSGEWEDSDKYFIEAYVTLNYLLDRENLVSKEAFEILTPYYKSKHFALFKSPIDLSEVTIYNLTDAHIEYVIKKDYDEDGIFIPYRSYKVIPSLLKHLDGYSIVLRMNKKTLNSIVGTGAEWTKYNEVAKKFKGNARAGNIVKSDDGKVSILLSA